MSEPRLEATGLNVSPERLPYRQLKGLLGMSGSDLPRDALTAPGAHCRLIGIPGALGFLSERVEILIAFAFHPAPLLVQFGLALLDAGDRARMPLLGRRQRLFGAIERGAAGARCRLGRRCRAAP